MTKLRQFVRQKYSDIILFLIIPVVTVWNFSHHQAGNPESVFAWDVKSYYAYLPAAIIHQDLYLNFVRNDTELSTKWIWPVETPIKQLSIVTSMGLSFLYLPFFLIGHAGALLSPVYEATGYTKPYAIALHYSALFYLMLGLFFLRKFLRNYFSEKVILITLLTIVFGTNLIFYVVRMATIPHAYNFCLFALFLLLTKNWHEKPDFKNTVFLGLISGLITLIRPTNIIVLLILIFWNVYSWRSLADKIRFLLRQYPMIFLMILSFLIVWIPQFLYWKMVSGRFLYFSYGELGGRFFWDNPQIQNILFSFRKGWFVYTPLALLSLVGIPFLAKKNKQFIIPLSIFFMVNIYVQASWWCWWFGGSFGLRAFVESYAILTIPLAALLEYLLRLRKGYLFMPVVVVLIAYNLFQVRQYNRQAIHYWWMSRESYRESFLKERPTVDYWEMIPVPEYSKARQGIYVARNLIRRSDVRPPITPEMLVKQIRKDVKPNDLGRGLKKRGSENKLSMDSLLTIEAWNIYETKRDLSEYIKPLEDSIRIMKENQTDSLSLNPVNQ